MSILTTPFDPVEYLTSSEAIDAFLAVYLEDGTPEELQEAREIAARARSAMAADR